MIQTAIQKTTSVVLHLLVDIGLISILFQVNNLEDISAIIKMATSFLISGISLVRLYYFIKEKKNSKKNDKNSSK